MRIRPCALLLLAGCARAPAPAPPVPGLDGWDSRETTTLADGVTHTAATRADAPWAVQIVTVDRTRCRPRIAARKAGPPLAERATTTELGADDLVAVNADFFLIPSGMPVGAHVESGRVLAGPGRRPVFAFDGERFSAGVASLRGSARAGSDSAAIGQVNRPLAGHPHQDTTRALALYGSWYGDTIVASARNPALSLRILEDGEEGTGIVAAVLDAGVFTPADGAAALRAGDDAAAWISRRAVGDTVHWRTAVVIDGMRTTEVVGGFPVLVREGRSVVPDQAGIIESFAARHPRTAVGWNDRSLFLVVVDGRQPGWSDGMTLDELADTMLRLGAREAINLDGGGSTAMTVRGRVVNRPSDAQGERPVANALALAGCR